MKGRITSLIACLAAVISIRSQAQAPDTKLQAFTRTNFYTGLINRALAPIPASVFKKCPTLVSKGSTVTVLRPASFGADGFPNAGVWKQSFPVSGCGNDTILNLYFSATADEKINTIIGVPGETRADLTLQRDALVYARIGAGLAAKDCKVFEPINSKFEGFGVSDSSIPDPGPTSRFRPWWETWSMTGCGHTIDLPLDFVPDKKGTQIFQRGKRIESRESHNRPTALLMISLASAGAVVAVQAT